MCECENVCERLNVCVIYISAVSEVAGTHSTHQYLSVIN